MDNLAIDQYTFGKNNQDSDLAMPHVLIIDDDKSLIDALCMTFEGAGYTVSCSANGQDGLKRIHKARPDVVVCDVNMPDLDGFSLCRKIREEGITIPFLILTSRDNEIDEALGLDLGADDYLSKPFSTRVLLARIQALLRRSAARAATAPSAKTDKSTSSLALDSERMEVTYRGKPILVTVSEFHLLEALTRHPGVVLSRSRLLDLIRPDDTFVGERIIDTYVRRLRRKFEEIEPKFDRLDTVVGAGYRWKDDGG